MRRRLILSFLWLPAAIAAAGADEASTWLQKAREAAGGLERLESIEDVEQQRFLQSTGMLGGQVIHQTMRYVLPDTVRQESRLPAGELAVFYSDGGGWLKSFQGNMALAGPQLAQARGEAFRLRERLLLADRRDDVTVAFVGETEIDERRAAELRVEAADGSEAVRLWIDAETGDLFRMAYQGVAVQGTPPEVIEQYADFREVDGLRLPHRTTILQNGRVMTTVQLGEVKLNQGLTVEELSRQGDKASN